jgi:hypothetical protein
VAIESPMLHEAGPPELAVSFLSPRVSRQSRWLRWMRRAWMPFVEKDSQFIPEKSINGNSGLKQLFLSLAWKVCPELQSGST